MNDAIALALKHVYPQLLPEMILVGIATLVFLGGTWRAQRDLWAAVSLLGIALAGLAVALHPVELPDLIATYATPVRFDHLTRLIRWVALGSGGLLVLLGWKQVPDRQAAEFHACLLIIVAGVALTAAANDLAVLFLALEMVSIPTYVLLYLPRHDSEAQEAAMKYFLLSVFSSALLLFGFSYLFGLAGTTNLCALQEAINGDTKTPVIAQVALIMVVAGLGFRITAVPFHFYAPDVYQGAPTVGAALLAVVPKVVGFVALLRVLGYVLPMGIEPRHGLFGMGLSDHVPVLFWFLAAVTMSLGNLLALLQDNVKRLLAYSSIAHAGYMLMAIAVAPYLHTNAGPEGLDALLYYLVAYGVMTVGAFAVLAQLDGTKDKVETVDDLAGLGSSHPGIALAMAVFLFSLIGIPLTAGFTGKFLIFLGAMSVPPADNATLFRVLTLIGAINAAIGGWYYLRIVAVMYLRQPLKPLEGRGTVPGLVTVVLCAVLTIGLSMPPAANWLLEGARYATLRAK